MKISPNLSMLEAATKRPTSGQLGDEDKSRLGRQLFDSQQKRLQGMQNSLAKLQEVKKNTSPKKAASQRAAMLKQRLETLKSVMQKLPPGDYKLLAREIKQIAKELAALSKQLGKSGAANLSLPMAMQGAQNPVADSGEGVPGAEIASEVTLDAAVAQIPVEVTAAVIDEAPVEAQPAADVAHAAELAEAEQLAEQAEVADKNDSSKLHLFAGNADEDDQDDKQLRAVLAESKKLLKEVLNLLKAKHQNNDKESRKIIASIERDLESLDQALGAIGPDLPDVASGAETSLGGFIDTTA